MNKLLTELCQYLKVKPQYLELLNERDMSDVCRQFAIWLLVGPDDGVLRFTKPDSLQYNAINRVAQLYIEDCKDVKRWKEAYYAAWHAADVDAAADGAAYYAAWSATAAAHANTASASAAAYYAAAAAADAAYYAAWSATAGAGAAAYYERMADKLVELLHAAPLMK